MKIYIVGGAIRDELLGREPKDIDFAVVGSNHQTMINNGFECVGKDFPVYLKNGDEYALARKERKVAAGSGGFEFDIDPSVTIEDDLSRRDLTVNAIARDRETGELIDPYNGIADLENRVLRHVSEAFREDPLRVLRVARFCARYDHLGFTIADETLSLMKDITRSGELMNLSKERIWKEILSVLGEASPHRFFEVLREVGALAVVLPEIDDLFGVPQHASSHPEIDCGIHALLSLRAAAKGSDCKLTRFISLIHDLGKAATPSDILPSHHGHEDAGELIVAGLMDRLKTPREWKRMAIITSKYHTHVHRAFELSPKGAIRFFGNVDAFRRPEGLTRLCEAAKYDALGRLGHSDKPYPQQEHILKLFDVAKNADLSDVVYSRADVKEQIAYIRAQAIALKFPRTNA